MIGRFGPRIGNLPVSRGGVSHSDVTLREVQVPGSLLHGVSSATLLIIWVPSGSPDGARAICEVSFQRLPPGHEISLANRPFRRRWRCGPHTTGLQLADS